MVHQMVRPRFSATLQILACQLAKCIPIFCALLKLHCSLINHCCCYNSNYCVILRAKNLKKLHFLKKYRYFYVLFEETLAGF